VVAEAKARLASRLAQEPMLCAIGVGGRSVSEKPGCFTLSPCVAGMLVVISDVGFGHEKRHCQAELPAIAVVRHVSPSRMTGNVVQPPPRPRGGRAFFLGPLDPNTNTAIPCV
jgi:hypothetical protein